MCGCSVSLSSVPIEDSLHSCSDARLPTIPRERVSRIYGEDRHYTHAVKRYIDLLRADPMWQVLDLPFGDGLTIVRHAGDGT